MRNTLKLVNTLKVNLPEAAIDSKPISDLIGRDARQVSKRIIPHFEDATEEMKPFGVLKSILMSLSK